VRDPRFPGNHGITLVAAVVYVIVNLIVDLSYALLDPRVMRDDATGFRRGIDRRGGDRAGGRCDGCRRTAAMLRVICCRRWVAR